MPTDSVTSHAPEPYNPGSGDRNTLALILTVILLVFFLLGFFSVHLCRYLASVSWLRRLNSPARENRQRLGLNSRVGLDPSLIDSLPTFIYSSVKEHQLGNYALECAVCLSEFEEDDILRLLPVCSHVFHRDCIDLWLESHTTCPVCRHDLNPPEEKSQSPEVIVQVTETDDRRSDENSEGGGEGERTPTPEATTTTPQLQRMSSKEEEEAVRGERGGEGGADVEDRKRHVADLDRLTRPHSTGHSPEGSPDGTRCHERYTLRLPEQVKERIWRQRNWTGSCIPFANFFEDPNKDDLDNRRSGLSGRGAESV